jgi:hypothetical protein
MLVALAACGQTATVAPTSTATPAPTATPTATAAMAASPLVVYVTPDPGRCANRPGGCATYVCHAPGGGACFELIDCTSLTAWPYYKLMNSGGAVISWSSHFSSVNAGPGNATISLSPSGGSLAAGASVSVTLTASESLAEHGPALFHVNFTSGGVNVDIPTQCSNG